MKLAQKTNVSKYWTPNTVDGRNFKQPPGMYKTLGQLPTSTGAVHSNTLKIIHWHRRPMDFTAPMWFQTHPILSQDEWHLQFQPRNIPNNLGQGVKVDVHSYWYVTYKSGQLRCRSSHSTVTSIEALSHLHQKAGYWVRGNTNYSFWEIQSMHIYVDFSMICPY